MGTKIATASKDLHFAQVRHRGNADDSAHGVRARPLHNADHMLSNLVKSEIAGFEVSLRDDPSVFKPTLTTSLLTEQVMLAGISSRSILDLGCGAGPIAIALAFAGARAVVAADIMPMACALTRRNAITNGVSDKIEVVQGDLFEPVQGRKFDVIVDDVSGVAEEVARLSSWFPPLVPLSGPDGTNLTIRMLRGAANYLNVGGHLFFPVLSLSNSAAIVSEARRLYADRLSLVAAKSIPFNQELKDHSLRLFELRERGQINFVQVRSRLFWTLEIYRVDA
jgi:SAM-dependent methyltransferase